MSMKAYLNAHTHARAVDPYYHAGDFFGGGDDYDYEGPEEETGEFVTSGLHQETPGWLVTGLEHYLELVDDEGKITPGRPGERFGHLAVAAEAGERDSFFDVTSDVLAVPSAPAWARKVDRPGMTDDVFVVRTSFSLGQPAGETPSVTPRLALDVVAVRGQSRHALWEKASSKSTRRRRIEVREEDMTDESGQPNTIIRVRSGISKPKTNPRISRPVARERDEDGKWVTPRDPAKAGGGLLRVVLKPTLPDHTTRFIRAE